MANPIICTVIKKGLKHSHSRMKFLTKVILHSTSGLEPLKLWSPISFLFYSIDNDLLVCEKSTFY